MLEKKETTALMITLISTKMFLTFPRTMIINSGNSAWIQAIYASITAVLIYAVTWALQRGNNNIIELAEKIGGKTLKIIVGTAVFVVLIINFMPIIRIFPETVKVVLLQDFNVNVIIAVFLIAIGIGAYIGLESIARINYMFMPIAGVVFVGFLLLLIPNYRAYNLMPLFGEGYKSIFVSGFHSISMFSDILLLNILLPHCKNTESAKKSGWKAIIISAVISVVILISYCMIYPFPASKEFMIPVYQLARVIHISSFFSRFEAIFQFVWSILILLYSATYIYTLCYVFEITFNLKHYKPLIFPITLISGTIAMIPNSLIDLMRIERTENIIVYPVAFLLPIIFGAVSRKYYGKLKRESEKDEEV